MIKLLEEKYLEDVATAHLLAWQKAYRGILSDSVLNGLDKKEFLSRWEQHIQNQNRKNYVALNNSNIAIGFISFENIKENNACVEIIGIYVHPEYWEQGHGTALMKKAISDVRSAEHFFKIILWTMTENNSARQFYEKSGFKPDSLIRTSERKGEQFQECRYSLEL